jgi:hypothetical protein
MTVPSWEECQEQAAVRYRANYAVRTAVKEGRLPRANTRTCAECGAPAHHYHHHRGYAEEHWLAVIALCRPCHPRVEARERLEQKGGG